MYQFVTTIQVLRNSENDVTRVMTINVLNDTSKNTLVATGRGLAIYPAGHISHGVLSKTPLDEKFDILEVLNNYDGFRKRILALFCERIHEDPLEWMIL